MIINMNLSTEWENYKKAEDDFFISQRKYFSLDVKHQVDDLRIALNSVVEVEVALRYLVNVEGGDLVDLIPDLVNVAIDGKETLHSKARYILNFYRNTYHTKTIVSHVELYIKNNKEDAWNYNNITLLYDHLGLEKELREFLNVFCKQNKDPHIREIFENHQEP